MQLGLKFKSFIFAFQLQYIKSINMAGTMIYPIDMDDFTDICGEGAFPLTQYLQRNLAEGGPVVTRDQSQGGDDNDDDNNSASAVKKSLALHSVSDTNSWLLGLSIH